MGTQFRAEAVVDAKGFRIRGTAQAHHSERVPARLSPFHRAGEREAALL